MNPSSAPALREALVAADFTYDRVAEVLGTRGHDALSRNETAPGLARTRGGSPVETLVRLFLLQTPVPAADAERALPGLVDRLAVDGLLERSVGEVAARLDCRPYAVDDRDLWVVSDLTPGLDGGPLRVGTDHVLGISHDALVVQREVLDPAAYVELWLKDAGRHGGPDYLDRYDTWLSWFDEQGVEAIGFGWINLHAVDADRSRTELLSWPYDVEQPIAPAIHAWGSAARTVAAGIAPEAHLAARPDVVQETHGPVGVEDPESIVLRQQVGFRRARTVDTVEAALVGACDGDLPVGAILDAVASLLDLEVEQVRATYLPVVADLVAEGFLVPAVS